MKRASLGTLLFVVAIPGVFPPAEATELAVPPHRVVVQVKGVVCSFCAYGTEKNLAQLAFLDHAQFGDGVLMEIHQSRITLALSPQQPVDLNGIYQAIKKGGYDPLTIHLRLSGQITKEGDRYLLTVADTGQRFELSGQGLEGLADGARVEVQVQLDADQIPSLPEGQPITVAVDNLEVRP